MIKYLVQVFKISYVILSVVIKNLKIKNFYHMVNYILFFIRIISLFDSVFIFKIRIDFCYNYIIMKLK